jgi:hypothetical protein
MNSAASLVPIPWDRDAFGLDVWEIRPGADGLAPSLGQARAPGIYTVRVDPRADKEPLHRHGFYYCDTQIVTTCDADTLRHRAHPAVHIELAPDIEPLLEICREAFSHSHFHRDFNLDPAGANRRFENWLRQLHRSGRVQQASWDGSLAGCFAHAGGGRLALYATAPSHQGRGRSRHLFGAGCADLLAGGERRLISPYSASNLAISNIHAGLGFRAIEAVDIYHRVIP